MRQGSMFVPALVLCVSVLSPIAASHAGPPAAENHESLPDWRLGMRTAPLLLLSRADVCADLGLTHKQVEDANVAITSLYARAVALRGKKGPQADAERKAVDDAHRVWFDEHLSGEQRARLLQIDLQWEGFSALSSRPIVADALGLSIEQRAALKQAVATRDATRAQDPANLKADHVLAKQALGLLSQGQQDRWGAMLGRTFVPQIAASPTPASRR